MGQAGPSTAGSTSPEGRREAAEDPRLVRQAEGYLLCIRADATPQQLDGFRQLLAERKHCMAYKLGDLTGYAGACGPATIDLVHDRGVPACTVSQRRRV